MFSDLTGERGVLMGCLAGVMEKFHLLKIGLALVLIFVGLTAYDTQKIKNMNIIGNEGTEEDHKEAIMGALALYLDFINLFLFLLRFLGDRK